MNKSDAESTDFKITGALVTGGGGFLGSHLAETLLRSGASVVCVDNFCTGLKENKDYLKTLVTNPDRFQFIEKDVIGDWSPWISQIEPKIRNRISHVFHFASPASPFYYQRYSLETMWVNSMGLNHAMDFADSCGARTVFASTSEIYGDPAVSPQPESYWGNVNTVGHRSCYDEAKRFGESLIFTRNEKFKTRHGIVRIFNTYGPRMNPNDGRVIINFLVQALRGNPLSILGDGSQTRSFCYVDDLVNGILAYANSEIVLPMNIGNEKEFTILELAQTVQKIFSQKNLPIEYFSLPSDDPKLRRPNLSFLKSQFPNWKVGTDLKSGLEKMILWLEGMPLEKFEIPGRPK